MAIVPGVNNVGNLRPQVRGQKTKEVLASRPQRPPLVKDVTPSKKPQRPPLLVKHVTPIETKKPQQTTVSEVMKVREEKTGKHKRGMSLRDLCPEDKQRVANLIKEIAKLSEEKDSAVVYLKQEREEFEQKIKSILTEKKDIVCERERIETQLVEYQTLVTDYQKKILEQQDRIADSISDALTPRKSPASSPRRLEDEFDGRVRRPIGQDGGRLNGRKDLKSTKNVLHDDAAGHHGNRCYDNYSSERRRPSFENYRYHDDDDEDDYYHDNRDYYRYRYRNDDDRDDNDDVTRSSPRYHGNNGRRRAAAHCADYDRRQNVVKGCEYGLRECDQVRNRYNEQYDRIRDLEDPCDPDDPKTKNRFEHIISKPFFGDRPFTQTLDSALEEQKKHTSPNHPTQSNIPYQNSTIPNKPRPPLEEPAFSSTPWNGDEVESRTPANDLFEPLVPERTTANLVHDELDDRKFLSYYKRLTPRERKEQLVAQKEALMREQNRLKDVLRQQEMLLAQKQAQLERQQEVQQHRLRVFEKTGYFPDNGPVVPAPTHDSPDRQRGSPVPSHVSIATSPIKLLNTATPPRRDVRRRRTSTDGDVKTSNYVDVATEMTQHGRSPRSENSMSILEIVDSLEDPGITPPKSRFTPPKRRSTPPERLATPLSPKSRPQSRSVVLESPVGGAVDLEESRVLEDIFFLNK